MLRFQIITLLGSLIGTLRVAYAECDMTRFFTGLDYPSAVAQMQVSQNSGCGTQLKARRQPGVVKTFHDVEILHRPLHGIAGKAPGFLFAYQPATDYIGHDRFAGGANSGTSRSDARKSRFSQ